MISISLLRRPLKAPRASSFPFRVCTLPVPTVPLATCISPLQGRPDPRYLGNGGLPEHWAVRRVPHRLHRPLPLGCIHRHPLHQVVNRGKRLSGFLQGHPPGNSSPREYSRRRLSTRRVARQNDLFSVQPGGVPTPAGGDPDGKTLLAWTPAGFRHPAGRSARSLFFTMSSISHHQQGVNE